MKSTAMKSTWCPWLLALLLVFLAFGARGLQRALPLDPEALTGIGLAAAILAGIVGLLFNDTFLAYTYASAELPLIGEVKLSTLLLFDVGVYVLVIGLVATAILRLGTDQP